MRTRGDRLVEDLRGAAWGRSGMGGRLAASVGRLRTRVADEEGATLVEMAVTSVIALILIFGMFQLSMALYSYHFVAEAAREASRFAIVRGSECAANFSKSYCSPTAGSGGGAQPQDVSAYVNGLGYPFAAKLSASTIWLEKSQDASGYDVWTSCGTSIACKHPFDHSVQVTVSYPYPLNVPFLKKITINMASKSSMVVSQ